MSRTIALLGVGKLGEALLSGLIRSGTPPQSLLGAEKHAERAAEIAERYGCRTADPADAVAQADVVLLAVKPQDMKALLAEVAGSVRPGTLVVSLAASITSSLVEELLPEGTPVVRVMTNTPVFVDEAMSALSAGSHAGSEHLALVEELLSPVGKVVRVPESQQDAVTALSGSGPAYFFFLVEAMIDAGILLGLPRAVAAELIVQTAVGSARMLCESGEHPVLLREAVTSPGGTTIAAIRTMEDHTTTDRTLATLHRLREEFPDTGAVVQAYLHRTLDDCRALATAGSRVRLCKGAYKEPESVAYQSPEDVDASYVRCLEVLMAGEGYPMVATHDPAMVDHALRLGRPGDFEFQMLYGIRPQEQERLAAAGHRVRVYVPYGDQWYGYLMRRLAERPANLVFFLRALASRS